MTEFNQPAEGGGYFESKDAVGHLVLITKVHEVYHNPTNVYAGKPQPRDEAKVDLVDLDGGANLRERVIVTHPGIVNRLVTGATNVLGRIGQVPTDKGNPAFVLDRYQDQDVPRAQQWVASYQAGSFQQGQSQPQAASSAPQAAPVAQQQPQAAPAPQMAQQAPPQQYQQQAPVQQAQAPQGVQLPDGVDPAALAAIMQQLGGQPIPQQQGQTPPY